MTMGPASAMIRALGWTTVLAPGTTIQSNDNKRKAWYIVTGNVAIVKKKKKEMSHRW